MAQQLIVKVFGSDAWAEEKCVLPCVRAEILGWWVNLISGRIRPSDKGIRKWTFTFFSLNANASHWPLEVCQLLASLAYRYSAGIMGMRPFVNPFYELCAGPQSVKWRKVSAKAKFAVEMWRVAIILLFLDKEGMSVPLYVLVVRPKSFEHIKFITDASYIGVGTLLLGGRCRLYFTFFMGGSVRKLRFFISFKVAQVSKSS